MNYYAQKVKQHKPLLLLCAILLVLCCLPAIIAAADDAVVWDNATEITISASTTSSLTVCWPEAVGAENYTVTYDKKWSGVSDKQTVSDATWSAEGYVISGLSECSRYDITVTPNMDNPVTTSAIGVTSSTKTGFVFVPISSFSGTTAPGRYQSMPMASNTASSDFVDVYTLSEDVTIGVDSIFSWYLQAGFNNTNPRDHIRGIRLLT